MPTSGDEIVDVFFDERKLRVLKLVHRTLDRDVFIVVDDGGEHWSVSVAHTPSSAAQLFTSAAVLRHLAAAGVQCVPRVLSSGRVRDEPALAVSWFEGRSLFELVTESGPQPRPLVLGWYHELRRVLHDVHAAGWVHRDVTPPNIVIGQGNQTAHLIDFGLAAAVGSSGGSSGECAKVFRRPHSECRARVEHDIDCLQLAMSFALVGGDEYFRLRLIGRLPSIDEA